ncbi:MAG TPA: dihydrolipoamide acetyltransferase family protein, partial [bacterium]|nr:dihydrolipoamide acetyltransferase family protein [bacterium]
MAEVIMPKMSDAMMEGKILSWRKGVGDPVARGEVIAEIETDKVNVEIEAEASGTLSQIVIPEGTPAAVGAVIAYINGGEAPAQGQAVTQPSPRAVPAGPPRPEAASTSPEEGAAEPTVVPRPSEAPPPEERIKASPIARRMAAEQGIDLAQMTGSGPGGRIVERDIEAYVAARRAAAPAALGRPAAAPEMDFEDIELSRMRQAIARTVVHSKQTIPHFYVTSEVDMTRALDLRAQLKAAYGEDQGRVSVNDLILKATSLALRKYPGLNAQFIEPATLRRFHRIHLGIMVAIPDGLVLPVLRDADCLPLFTLAREARRLVEGARQRHLRQEDYTGAAFAVSNLGMYDVTNFTAIINPPQPGILAVGRTQERPVVRDGQIVARPM